MSAILPLRDLTPYLPPGWWVAGRIIRLDSCKPYANDNGQGFVFTFALADDTQTMECVAFGMHARALSVKLGKDKVYIFKQLRLVKKKSGYSTVDAPYQLQITDSNEVEETTGVQATRCATTPVVDVALVEFEDIPAVLRASLRLDLLGIVVQKEDAVTVTSRTTNQPLQKAGLLLENGTSQQVAITLWGEQALESETFPLNHALILVDVHGELGEDGVPILTSQHGTCLYDASNYDEGKTLKNTFLQVSVETAKTLLTAHLNFEKGSRTPVKLVSAISLSVRNQKETDYFRVIGIVTAMPFNPRFYMRCPLAKCGAKVQKNAYNRFECTKCNAATLQPSVGMNLVVDVQDYSGSAMLTLFNEAAATFAGVSLAVAKNSHDRDAGDFAERLRERRFLHFEFRVSVAENTAGVFSAKCWAVRAISEQYLERLLATMKEENATCVVKNAPPTLDS